MTENGEIIRLFLEDPRSRKQFDPFFKLCYRHVIGYLRYLKVKGYRLPEEMVSAQNPLSDLTIDILGPFLRSARNRPFFLIFDFFQHQGTSDFKHTDTTQLYDLFKSMLFRFTRQELSRITGNANNQLDHLKRRFKDILKGNEYVTFSRDNGRIEYIRLKDDDTIEPRECPVVPYERLLILAEEVYHSSKTRKEWCRNVFRLLSGDTSVQNCLVKHELLSAVIVVNMKYVQADGLHPSLPPSTEYRLTERVAKESREETLQWLSKNMLEKFVQKGQITAEIAERFRGAVDRYLIDLIYSSDVDLVPIYFREVMPEDEHEKYLKDYKYIFETAITKADEEFKRRVRKNL